MAIDLNKTLEWLRKRREDSLRNQAIFDAVPFEQTEHGFMARNYKKPEVKNKLVEKRGDTTLTKEWVDPDSSTLMSRSLSDAGEAGPWMSYEGGIPSSPLEWSASPAPIPPDRVEFMNRGINRLDPGAHMGIGAGAMPASADPYGYRWGSPVTQAQANIVTDERPGYGDPRRGYVLGDTMAPGVGSVPLPNRPGPELGFDDRQSAATYVGADLYEEPRRRNIFNLGQNIRDRQERNRIRRLMQYNTHNPYYATGNPYGLDLMNRNPYPRGIY